MAKASIVRMIKPETMLMVLTTPLIENYQFMVYESFGRC
jgi:hypothetical protein